MDWGLESIHSFLFDSPIYQVVPLQNGLRKESVKVTGHRCEIGTILPSGCPRWLYIFRGVLSESLSYGRLCKSVATSMDTNCSMKVQTMIFFRLRRIINFQFAATLIVYKN